MDKYEFNIKVEQIKKLVTKGDFTTSMKIADTIDWHRVRNTNLLSMISQVYEKNGEYREAKEVLLQAYDRAPVGKRLLFKLAELALREGNVREAESYYREFCETASGDPRQHLLRYLILKAKGATPRQLSYALERYVDTELDEKWMYELAELYATTGERQKCIQLCDKITLMFAFGKYVDKAIKLKVRFAPLSEYQNDLVRNPDKYEAKLKAVEQEFASGGVDLLGEDENAAEMPEEDYEQTGEEADGYEEEPEYIPDTYEQEYPDYSQEQMTPEDDLAANIHQAMAEEKLAQEMSRMSEAGTMEEEQVVGGKTKRLYDIHRALPSALRRQPAAEEETAEGETETAEEAPPEIWKESQEDGESPLPETGAEETAGSAGEDAEGTSAEDGGQGSEEADPSENRPKDEAPVPQYMAIDTRTPEKGMKVTVDLLKKYHKQHESHNQVVKISGSRLNERGISNVSGQLTGRDLIIDEAGDLTGEELEHLTEFISSDESGRAVVLLDNPRQIEELYQKNPEQLQMFEHIDGEKEAEEAAQAAAESAPAPEETESAPEETKAAEKTETRTREPENEEMDADAFAEYACQYAAKIDCNITGKTMLALYERVELMEEDGIPLTRANAEALIEEAADKAEKPSLARLITGVFSAKYDKEGLLILREEHFI